jgi:hypothetical protein
MKKWQLISLISSSVIFGVTILTTIGVIASRLQQHNENNTIDSGMISINVTLADGHYGSDIRSNSGPIHCSEGYSASIGKEFIVNTLECFYYSYFFPYTSPSGEYFCEMTFGKEPQPESD